MKYKHTGKVTEWCIYKKEMLQTNYTARWGDYYMGMRRYRERRGGGHLRDARGKCYVYTQVYT